MYYLNFSFYFQNKPWVIVRATTADCAPLIEVMYRSYYPAEPTFLAAGLCCERNSSFDVAVAKDLSEGLTLLAKTKECGTIVGGSVNRRSCPWDPDALEQFACNLACNKTRLLLNFYAYVARRPNIWERFRTNSIFEVKSKTIYITI